MPQELFQINTAKAAPRVLLILLLAAATFWSYFAVRWYLGNTLAEYYDLSDTTLQKAQTAESLAPADPLTHWRLGEFAQKKLPPDQLGQAIREYERAVSLSPNDYRFWTSLGTALEQSGDSEKGELALRQAVALAPNYAYPHWFLGNLLLRSARYEEALQELERASKADPTFLPQLFNIIWEIHGETFDALKTDLPTPESRAEFAIYLFGRQKYDEGLRMWNTLSGPEKKANRTSGDSLINMLVAIKRFHDAMDVWNEIAPGEAYRVAIASILDGGFEADMVHGNASVFGWQVAAVPQMQIGIDAAKAHDGSRSLRLTFQVRAKLSSINASQLIPVDSSKQYELSWFLKTEKLQSGGTPLLEIADATDGAVIASSAPVPDGDNDWQPFSLSFKTGAKTQAVIIRIVAGSCGDAPVCPIFGSIWYDDFSIKPRN